MYRASVPVQGCTFTFTLRFIFSTLGLGAHPASCTMGIVSFPEVKSGRGVTLTPHHLLVPWSRKSTAVPLLPLWAVRPVQSLSACTRVHLYLYLTFYILHVSRIRVKGLMKNSTTAAEFHTDGQRECRTDTTELTVSFRNFANAPKY